MNLSWNKSSVIWLLTGIDGVERLLSIEAASAGGDHLVSLRSLADNSLPLREKQNLTLFLQENFWSKTDRFAFRRSSVEQS